MRSLLPKGVWTVGRIAALAVALGAALYIVVDPPRGLQLFWQVLLPSLPLLFAAAPGIWRQICPMAYLNQMAAGSSLAQGRTMSAGWLDASFLVAVAGFVLFIFLRRPLLHDSALATAALVLLGLGLAFAGGLAFKARSGWCGTFCPLGPLQRLYGHAPPVVEPNGYCPTCVGCQHNCYDFKPTAAMFADLNDLEPRLSEHRLLFAGVLPGLVLGIAFADPWGIRGFASYAAEFFGCVLLTIGLFYLAKSLLPVSPYRVAAVFGMAALVLFYWVEAPPMVGALRNFTGLDLPYHSNYAIVGLAVLVAGRILKTGFDNELAYQRERASAAEPRVGIDETALAQGRMLLGRQVIRERSSGRSFPVDAKRPLLDILESGGVRLTFGCRSGVCGADPVAIVQGSKNLDPPSADEIATLKRLGLEGRARMACTCRVRGPVEIDLSADLTSAPAQTAAASDRDAAAEAGIRRVVIIGNGVAGVTAADLLRQRSPSCQIDVVTRENFHFYNRMALGRVMYGKSGMDGLQLMPSSWFGQRRIAVWLNTIAVAIDPARRQVRLGTGELLPYDRLVLAQGASGQLPGVPGANLPGAFVLREADDALRMRSWSQSAGCREAVVIGGGVLGVEAAVALHNLDLRVTLVQKADRLMDRNLDRPAARILERFLGGLGIDVRVDADVAAITGKDRVAGVRLADGEEIAAQLCLFCAGVRPNAELAAGAGLKVGGGVVVDDNMRTSDRNIFALGDVAEPADGGVGLWTTAARQAEIAVAAMLGEPMPDVRVNRAVHLKVPGMDLKSFGPTVAGEGERQLTDPTASEQEHRKIILAGDRIVGAVLAGPPGATRQFAAMSAGLPLPRPVLDRLEAGDWSALEEVAAEASSADGG
jgi:NADPH-dependent 2,4-dienoyl-CoA reductase/sulfur reductase-like enzyme/ferredoxin